MALKSILPFKLLISMILLMVMVVTMLLLMVVKGDYGGSNADFDTF